MMWGSALDTIQTYHPSDSASRYLRLAESEGGYVQLHAHMVGLDYVVQEILAGRDAFLSGAPF